MQPSVMMRFAVMTTVDEVSDKTKVSDGILRSVLLDCFTAESDE